MSFTPNTTPTPNWLYNGEMKKMSGTELKVVMLVTRKTLGWFDPLSNERKTQDYISQSQFVEFTGQSHTSIAQAIQSAVNHGWIIARDKNGALCETSEKRRRRKVWYQLGNIFIDKISKQESGLDENLSNFSKKSKQLFESNLSKKVDNTKETITKVINTNTSSSATPTDNSFDVFWDLYPRKVEKKKALQKWNKLKPEIKKIIIADLPKRKMQSQWMKGFVPHPTTYLNGERWNDELEDSQITEIPTFKGYKIN